MKVDIIGAGHPSSASIGLTTAQEVQRVEIANRRKFMSSVIEEHKREGYFIRFLELSNKHLKKQSKGFILIHRYIEGLGLERYYETTATPVPAQAHRIAVMLNSMIGSKPFTLLNLEKADTDYFQLLVGLYMCMKSVTANFMKLYPNDKRVAELTHVSSEIGLRLYSLYEDTRLSDVNSDYEEVRLR